MSEMTETATRCQNTNAEENFSVHGRQNASVSVSCVQAMQVVDAKVQTCTGSESRRKARYRRRQEKRTLHKEFRAKLIGNIEDVFTFDKMYRYGKDCCKEIRWKQSVQNFEHHLFSDTAKRRRELLESKHKWKRLFHFVLHERGKIRQIDAPHIHDRQIQKVFTKEVLLPYYSPYLIENNGASLKNKGLQFSQKMLCRDLQRHFRKYGMSGYVILTDCKKFFPSADHEYIKDQHKKIILNNDLRKLADSIISFFGINKGVPLGVEPSQIEMIHYPSKLDNFVKCQLGIRAFGHYMDDYYAIIPPDKDPKKILEAIKETARKNCINLSLNKTCIIPFGKPFRFCKTKYEIFPTGKIVKHGCRDAAKRLRHKLKYFARRIAEHQMSYSDLWSAIQSVMNYYSKNNDHGRILSLKRYFFKLFKFTCDDYSTFKSLDQDVQWRNDEYAICLPYTL